MSRHFRLRLTDILEAIDTIKAYLGETDSEGFKQNRQLIDSVLFNLMVIGEAANNVPHAIQETHPDVDWRNIVGLRNVVSHEYFRLNLDRIWDITQAALPEFREQVMTILENTPPNDEQ